jgi:hypothetical protein
MVDDGEGDKKADEGENPGLGAKDYLALTVAALETFLLPLLVLIAVVALMALFFAFRP